MKLVTSEMDAEAEKWDEPQNEIAKVSFLTLKKTSENVRFRFFSERKICRQWRFRCIFSHVAKELYEQHKIFLHKRITSLKKEHVYLQLFSNLRIKFVEKTSTIQRFEDFLLI